MVINGIICAMIIGFFAVIAWQTVSRHEHMRHMADVAVGAPGYGGIVDARVVVQNDRIVRVDFPPNKETPSFWKRLVDTGFLHRWDGYRVDAALGLPFDAVSGATVSSRAAYDAVMHDLQALRPKTVFSVDHKSISVIGILWLTGVWMLVVLSFFRSAWMHTFLMRAARIVIIGFGGVSLSMITVKTLLSDGVSTAVWCPAVLLGVSLVSGICTKRNVYCSSLCAMGALQESVAPKDSVVLSITRQRLLRTAGILYVCAAWVAVFLCAADPTVLEPFAAFSWQSASRWTIVLFAGVVLVSVFAPRCWCKYACPTGTLLSLLVPRRKMTGDKEGSVAGDQ
jgi:uncharacterized protein with FMN-binding domain